MASFSTSRRADSFLTEAARVRVDWRSAFVGSEGSGGSGFGSLGVTVAFEEGGAGAEEPALV